MENEAVSMGDTERAKLSSVLASRGVFVRELMISLDVKVFLGAKGKKGGATAWDVAVVENGEVSTGPSSPDRRPVMETPPCKAARLSDGLTPTPPPPEVVPCLHVCRWVGMSLWRAGFTPPTSLSAVML